MTDIGFCLGWAFGVALGSVLMWYFSRRSPWHRTRGEFNLARGIGNGAIDVLCEQIRKDTLKGMSNTKL